MGCTFRVVTCRAVWALASEAAGLLDPFVGRLVSLLVILPPLLVALGVGVVVAWRADVLRALVAVVAMHVLTATSSMWEPVARTVAWALVATAVLAALVGVAAVLRRRPAVRSLLARPRASLAGMLALWGAPLVVAALVWAAVRGATGRAQLEGHLEAAGAGIAVLVALAWWCWSAAASVRTAGTTEGATEGTTEGTTATDVPAAEDHLLTRAVPARGRGAVMAALTGALVAGALLDHGAGAYIVSARQLPSAATEAALASVVVATIAVWCLEGRGTAVVPPGTSSSTGATGDRAPQAAATEPSPLAGVDDAGSGAR